MESMAACATVTQVETKGEFARRMRLSPPTIVVAIDAGISKLENSTVLNQLLQYTREVGITICCCNFSNNITSATFFAAWGLPWDLGSYFRTTVQLNRTATGISLEGLPESYSLKALLLLNVARNHRIYAPSSSSRIESKVFGPNEIPIDTNETPCAYGPVERGWFGYVGDVNNEDGSTRVVMAMARLSQSAVVADRTNRTSGFSISLDGRPTETQPIEDPNQIVMFTDTIKKAGQVDFISGHRMGRAWERPGAAPAPQSSISSPSSRTYVHSPPRPREDEVEARAAKRAGKSKQKSKQADAFKEQGNKFFLQGKYQEAAKEYKKAIDVHGPRPIYNTNLAAAYLKLHMYQQAEECCDEALKYDPKSVKARYRRGVARRDMFAFRSAMEDFRACAKLAPRDSQFRKEIARTQKESNQHRAAGIPDQFVEQGCEPQYLSDDDDGDDDSFFDPPLDVPGKPLQSDSDTSDYEHEGNGQPCRAYNRDGCSQGSKCTFRHSAEEHTTRDELGRNVCNFWLADTCTSGSQCPYAHSKEYLPEKGWWNEKGMDDTMKGLMRDISRIRNM
ncbi:uncharacterized protein EV420DRAFT_1565514 [Desarmillaria tabescens]|uniref:C3H1-type domain-containing protein n=1 Tax=Armillaria tabescens TaxID=1929756 RepID=A0AA39JYP7_ARMTA|nr:uncharacterized protein EV420DRAFT_1565514 [Desarmillaria tabescens]KAK0449023.1 hypothetical protein EV420DRAFT_1565514 [Desarmillaria tabescens]